MLRCRGLVLAEQRLDLMAGRGDDGRGVVRHQAVAGVVGEDEEDEDGGEDAAEGARWLRGAAGDAVVLGQATLLVHGGMDAVHLCVLSRLLKLIISGYSSFGRWKETADGVVFDAKR